MLNMYICMVCSIFYREKKKHAHEHTYNVRYCEQVLKEFSTLRLLQNQSIFLSLCLSFLVLTCMCVSMCAFVRASYFYLLNYWRISNWFLHEMHNFVLTNDAFNFQWLSVYVVFFSSFARMKRNCVFLSKNFFMTCDKNCKHAHIRNESFNKVQKHRDMNKYNKKYFIIWP